MKIKAYSYVTVLDVSDNSIASVDVMYYLSDSNAELIGGSWQTDPPPWQDGKYYWQKTVTTFTDPLKPASETNPICITGETPQEERNSLVEEFKTGNHKLLIANISTLNTSVTITDVTCQIYIERGFNYSNYEQSTRRIYRIGQDKPVISYILIYENTLDVLTDKNLSSKGMLVDGLLSKNFLTQEQWSEIFNLNSSDTNF